MLKEQRKTLGSIQCSEIKTVILNKVSNLDLTDYTLEVYSNNLVALYTNIIKEIGLKDIQIIGEQISDGKYNLYYTNTNNNYSSEMIVKAWDSCITIESNIERVIEELGYTIIADRKGK